MPITNPLKAISKTDDELRVRNAIVLFGGRDLEFVRSGPNPDKSLGTRFDPNVLVTSPFTENNSLPVGWEHGENPDGMANKASDFGPMGFVDWSTAQRDEKGIFVDRVLNRRHRYVQFVEDLIEAGLVGTSSEAVPEGIKCLEDGTITEWPLMGDTLTVSPTEPRMLAEFGDNVLHAIKGLANLNPEIPAIKSLLISIEAESQPQAGSEEVPQSGGPAETGVLDQAPTTQPNKAICNKEKKSMNLMDLIKNLLPDLKDEDYTKLASILALAGLAPAAEETQEAGAQGNEPTVAPGSEPMRALDLPKVIAALKGLGYSPILPAAAQVPAATRPPFDFGGSQPAAPASAASKSLQAAYVMRFGEETSAQKAILEDYIGADYREKVHNQNIAFAKYLRGGERALSTADVKALSVLYFPFEQVYSAVRDGASIRSVKATQVEAIGEMGGYAVPPNSQSEISKRSAGLTAVRGAGARVIQLVNSNGIEIPIYRGDSTKYMGLLRGQWGTETKVPGAQNVKVDLEMVVAHVYTYKVPMSVSMLEDAANLVSLVEQDIASTKAIDEDGCFLVGDGVGKPRGILPGGTNADGLKEVISGSAAALTANGVNKLKRGLPTQYRDVSKTVWVGNTTTFGDIENLTIGGGNLTPAFPELAESDKIRGYRSFESEFMPDVAANAYPLIYGNMGGYTIVERLGMTIERFKDSGTGPNVVEFHVRARVGGRVETPWNFAVQKVAAA